jgi:hypothetical protein
MAKTDDKLIGFSQRINDPAFKRYQKNRTLWTVYFTIGISMIAVIGFYLYGVYSQEIDNPEATYVGIIIAGMFLLIAFYQIINYRISGTWDGVVIDKKNEQRQRKMYTTDEEYNWEEYKVYTIIIQSDKNKLHTMRSEDDTTMFNYFQIGDRVRHHGGLNSFEKYDKSKDTIIFCNACGSMNNIEEDHCIRCHCPLLK